MVVKYKEAVKNNKLCKYFKDKRQYSIDSPNAKYTNCLGYVNGVKMGSSYGIIHPRDYADETVQVDEIDINNV